jgi:hypothetical protein
VHEDSVGIGVRAKREIDLRLGPGLRLPEATAATRRLHGHNELPRRNAILKRATWQEGKQKMLAPVKAATERKKEKVEQTHTEGAGSAGERREVNREGGRRLESEVVGKVVGGEDLKATHRQGGMEVWSDLRDVGE